jgi:hypothetical protein
MKKTFLLVLAFSIFSCNKQPNEVLDMRQKRLGRYIGTAKQHYLTDTRTIPYIYTDTTYIDTFFVAINNNDTSRYAITISPAKVIDGTWLKLDSTFTKFEYSYWGGNRSYGLHGYFTENDSMYYDTGGSYFSVTQGTYSFKGQKK